MREACAAGAILHSPMLTDTLVLAFDILKMYAAAMLAKACIPSSGPLTDERFITAI